MSLDRFEDVESLATWLIVASGRSRFGCIEREEATALARALLVKYDIKPKEESCLIDQ